MNRIFFSLTMRASILLISSLLFSSNIFGNNGQKSIFDLMNFKEVLDVTLEADFTNLKNNRRNEDYHQAVFTFKDENGKKQNWDLKVKLRGAFRRIHCQEVPPLKLNFKKSELRSAGLAEFDDLKLVPYCMGTEDVMKDVLFREYLTYKMFNAITDYSFRVQLLRITYKDAANGQKTHQWAFLIEDAAQFRDRIGAEKMDESNAFNLPADLFDRDYLKTVAVFQYMTGNMDWSLGSGKNLKFLKKDGKILAIPYDFDYTGLVNAPYFAPDSDFALTSREQRVFLGFPVDVDSLQPAVQLLAGKRQVLEDIIKKFRPLAPASRRDILAYLATYFDNPAIVKPKATVVARNENSQVQLQD